MFEQTTKNEAPFDNYCAILMSECMSRSGIKLESCPGVKCWSYAGSKHVIRAEGLVKALPKEFADKVDITPSKFQKQLSGRTCVVFLRITGPEQQKFSELQRRSYRLR
ncbi:hypothetical protein SG34_030385 [Thalassomonas viridans]|uniref:Uncharacterized protein n=1 Tax=Thalassomonas viridans TaxID=137584 RepID=A0AAE9ZAB0_9GAMM|nr:T6SS effector amidase Tae4 family protein [Thalassomonas viridans]WDE09082.1 hypothetical protein SG34_030385 [Thalassomonas viridans]